MRALDPTLRARMAMSTRSPFLPDLEARGLLHQVSDPAVNALFAEERVTAYIGFDPTAASLHVGHLLPALTLARLQRAGHRPIAVVGGATGQIGDPSGKTSERSLLDRERIAANVAAIRGQLEQFLDFSGPSAASLADNADWLGSMPLLDFLRDVGKHFSVNAMIARDSVRLRLEEREHGISYTEFSYMLLQAYDFLALYDRFGCKVQLGGSDQWGNIVSGADLIRRMRGGQAYAVTMPLVTKADGTKFGKSEAGNLWLDPAMTPPYAFYQFWLNVDDRDVGKYLKFFTFLDIAHIAHLEAEAARAPQERAAQRALAAEVTSLVHGPDACRRAQQTTEVLFGEGDWRTLSAGDIEAAFAAAPRTELSKGLLGTPDADLVALLATAELFPSRGQARKQVEAGGISVNGVTERDPARRLSAADVLAGGYVVMRRGKKTFHVLRFG
jgi:tyrosyl-tRNA synthetase